MPLTPEERAEAKRRLELLIEQGGSVRELARDLDVSPQTLTNLLKGAVKKQQEGTAETLRAWLAGRAPKAKTNGAKTNGDQLPTVLLEQLEKQMAHLAKQTALIERQAAAIDSQAATMGRLEHRIVQLESAGALLGAIKLEGELGGLMRGLDETLRHHVLEHARSTAELARQTGRYHKPSGEVSKQAAAAAATRTGIDPRDVLDTMLETATSSEIAAAVRAIYDTRGFRGQPLKVVGERSVVRELEADGWGDGDTPRGGG